MQALLGLQGSIGNRALGAMLAQRSPMKTAPVGDKVDPLTAAARTFASHEAGDLFEARNSHDELSTIVAVGHNTTYAMDLDGDSVRLLSFRPKGALKGTERGFIDVRGTRWTNAEGTLVAYDEDHLTGDETRALVEALGIEWGGSEPVWIYVVLGEDADFAPQAPPPDPKSEHDGDTPAMRKRAAATVAALEAAWKDRPDPKHSALAGKPAFTSRYSERTGWHIRITLDTEQTEVKLTAADSTEAVDERVAAAVDRMRAQYDTPGAQHATFTGGKNDPKAPPPPDWWVPFEESEAVKDGEQGATAPRLPAEILYKPKPEDTHPTVVAGATYDFKMRVHWEFGGQYGFAEAMNEGYYWELLAASPADWSRLSGEQAVPPRAAPAGGAAPAREQPAAGTQPNGGASSGNGAQPATAPATAPAADPATPAKAPKKLEDTKIGTGDRQSRKDDMLSKGHYEGERVSEDMAADLDEGDYSGFVGEDIAGGYRILSTHAMSLIGDVLDYRDLSNRRIRFEEPGYYIVRCMAATTGSTKDPNSYIRSPSVAVIPIKVQKPKAVAKQSAISSLADAGGTGGYERWQASLASDKQMVGAGTSLQHRFSADATLAGRLDADPIGVGNDFSAPELLFLTVADGQRMSVDALTKVYEAQQKAEDDGGDKIEEWYGELKENDGGRRDYPVGASFVVTETGEEIPLRLMVGEAKDSTDDRPHWTIFDITSSQSRDRYEGYANVGGVPIPAAAGGHEIALRSALREFAGGNPYGYGEIGLAWPEHFRGIDLNAKLMPNFLHSAPNAEKRKKHRHENYVKIATLIATVATFGGEGALEEAAQLAVNLMSAANAIEAIRDRIRTGHLWELGTLLDIAQVVGGVKALGSGARSVLAASKTVKAVRATEKGLELLTVLEHGLQTVSIPIALWEQLKAIDQMPEGTSGLHKAALAAFAFGRAVRDGTVLVHSITAEEAPRFYDDSKEHEQEGKAPKQLPPGSTPPEPDDQQKKPKDDEPGVGLPPVGAPAAGSGTPKGKTYTTETVPGMSKHVAGTVQGMCDEYGVVIDVRPTTGTAPEWRGKGAVPKPEVIKAKTINEYDRLLGAPEGAIGLVGYFDPKLPRRPSGMDDHDWAALNNRFQQRQKEFTGLASDMAKLEKAGTVRVEGKVVMLVNPHVGAGEQQYSPVTGDHDLFDIHWADGRKMTDEAADAIANLMRGMNVDIEHPAHMRWKPTNAKDQKMYDDIAKQHSGGADHTQDLIRFEPGQAPHDAKAGDAITPVQPRKGRKWDSGGSGPGGSGSGGPGHDGGGHEGGGGGGGAGPSGSGGGGNHDRDESDFGDIDDPRYGRTKAERQQLIQGAQRTRAAAFQRLDALPHGMDPAERNYRYRRELAQVDFAQARRDHPEEAGVWDRIEDAYATLRDPNAIAEAIYAIRLGADAAGITPTEYLVRFFGGEQNMGHVLGNDDFVPASRGDAPPIDDPFAKDVHGSFPHIFQEYLLALHWMHEPGGGRRAAGDFRRAIFDLTRPGVPRGADTPPMYTTVWDALFDEDRANHINRPEKLTPILVDALGLPGATPNGAP